MPPNYEIFLFSALLAGQLEGHPACKKLGVGLLVVTIWLELCTSYSSSCHHHFHHPSLQQNRLTQVHLESGRWKFLDDQSEHVKQHQRFLFTNFIKGNANRRLLWSGLVLILQGDLDDAPNCFQNRRLLWSGLILILQGDLDDSPNCFQNCHFFTIPKPIHLQNNNYLHKINKVNVRQSDDDTNLPLDTLTVGRLSFLEVFIWPWAFTFPNVEHRSNKYLEPRLVTCNKTHTQQTLQVTLQYWP